MKMTWCSFSRNILLVFLVLSSFYAVLAASSSDVVSVPARSEGQSNAVQGRVQLEKSQPAIDEIGARIINGTDVPLNTYPWYTRLLIDDDFACGGILVAPDYVLTAAHCIDSANPDDYTAQVGALCEPFESGDNCEQDVEEFGILDFIVHPDYDDYYVPNNDYALIRLNGNSTIQPVMIDSGAFSPTYTEEKQLWGIGLGVLDWFTYDLPDHLQHVELSYITNENCVSVYGDFFLPELGADINSVMCTFTPFKDACQGDFGGPLYDSENDVVVGIMSWGFGCAYDFPGVHARISTHFPWIRENICANSPSASICGVSIPPTVSPSPTVSFTPTATTCDVDEFKLAIRADLYPGYYDIFLAANNYTANILQYDIYSPNGTLLDSGSLSSLDNEENVACFPKSTSCDNNYKLTLEDSSGEDSSLTWDGNNVTVEVDDEIVFEADLFEDIFNAPDFEIEFGVFQAPGNSSCAPSLSPVPSISPTTNDEFCSIEDHFELVIVFYTTDYYPQESVWNITDDNGDVIAVEGSFAEGEKLHVDKFCFPENCDTNDGDYTINFIDFYGDGLSYGGYYKVVVNGERVDTGGDDFINATLNSEYVSTCPSSVTSTSSPSASPSTSPSAAPCSENEIFISAEVKTDKYPFETSFALFSGVGNGAEEIERIDPSEPNEVTMASRCVPELGQYTFRIDDAAGDGLNDASEAGFFKVFVDGVQVFGDSDGTNFGFSDVVIIDSASASPSKSPTPSPTGSPSISPTPSPTRSPTISPAEDTKSAKGTKGSKGTKDSTKGTKGTYSY